MKDTRKLFSGRFSESRPMGKTIPALLEFLSEGKKGKSVVYATIIGNFLSPKAVENVANDVVPPELDEDYFDGDYNVKYAEAFREGYEQARKTAKVRARKYKSKSNE